jgi:transcriptional regulator with XRE-family HTH domain
MPVTISPAVLKRRVRLDLQRHRSERGWILREAAEASGVKIAMLGHYESGRNVPSDSAATRLLRAYGVEEELPEFLALIAQARSRTPSAAAGDPDQFNLYVGLEQGATGIQSFDALVLHGLAQTEQYAEALMRGHGQALTVAEVRRRLRLRLRRQDVLTGDNPAQLCLLIKQAVLAEPVGGRDIMRAQLDHLLALGQQPNVDIQVIPRDVVAYPALHGPFIGMQFPLDGDPGLVYIETRVKGLFIEEASELQQYTQIVDYLRDLAASPDESATIIDAMRKDIS